MAMLKVACVVLVCMVVVALAPPLAEAAVTCGTVQSAVAPCIGYLRNGGVVPANCCNGIRSLNNAAKTTPDRQTACRCLQSASGKITGLKPALASGLPGKCGVSVPYKISPSTDCSKVK
ncbi:non-specific lipid-transfer protein 1-like [Cornus florida]|uniref:non-specific lipid-transfer protein 1-like n=1 Tax=Cornus florida TaxID=4283 RepID=UPI0028A0B1DA|nr:non-specific lipid-transfer protein 1-like [Cornus florida]